MKKIIALLLIAAVIVFVFFKFGGGFGSGGNGDGSKTQSESTEKKTEEKTEQKEEKEIPLTVIVKIYEDKVTINDTPVENAEELKKIVEDYNTDSRKFVLEENKSILETYKWVTGVFIDLGIALSGEG